MKNLGILAHKQLPYFSVKFYLIIKTEPVIGGSSSTLQYWGYMIRDRSFLGSLEVFIAPADLIQWLSLEECLTHPSGQIREAALTYLGNKIEAPLNSTQVTN